MWTGTLSRAVTLIHLTLSQHFVTVALAGPLGREAQTLWGDLKSAVGKASKCPKPKHLNDRNACEWFTCKYKYHKSKLEKMKTKMEAEFKNQSVVAAWLTKLRGEKTAEDYMLSSMKTRRRYYKIFFYSVALHDGKCDPEKKTLEKLLDWTTITFPERYECIEKVVGKHSESHTICVEGFTHAFKTDMFLKCKNKKFYTEDKPPQMHGDDNGSDGEKKHGAGLPARQERSINFSSNLEEDPLHVAAEAPLDDNDLTNRRKFIAKTATVAVASGVVAGAILTAKANAMWTSIYSVVFTAVQTSGETALASAIAISVASALVPAMIFLGLGILGAIIAFLVCKYWPANNRDGVRFLSKRQHKIAGVTVASSPLD